MGLLALKMEDGRRGHEPRSGEKLLEAGKGKEMASPPEPPEGMLCCWHLHCSPVLSHWVVVFVIEAIGNGYRYWLPRSVKRNGHPSSQGNGTVTVDHFGEPDLPKITFREMHGVFASFEQNPARLEPCWGSLAIVSRTSPTTITKQRSLPDELSRLWFIRKQSASDLLCFF